jgi:predicted component of type VI protein secretion system
MLKSKLLVVGGEAKSGEFELRLPTTIGRGREAALTLPHPLVSRVHCELFERDGKLVVKDLESLNGTFVNNQKIVGEKVLEPEQLLTLGNVTFRAVYQMGEVIEASDVNECPVAEPAVAADLKTIRDLDSASQDDVNVKETVYDDRNCSDTDSSMPSVSFAKEVPQSNSVAAVECTVGQNSAIPAHADTIQPGSPEMGASRDVRKLPR